MEKKRCDFSLGGEREKLPREKLEEYAIRTVGTKTSKNASSNCTPKTPCVFSCIRSD